MTHCNFPSRDKNQRDNFEIARAFAEDRISSRKLFDWMGITEHMQSHFSNKGGSMLALQPDTKRIFDAITKTWNPVIGCLHSCSYCWARRLVATRLKNSEKYKDGFTPKLVEKELGRKFRDQFVFVSDMGDLFGDWVPSEWITKVIDAIRQSPNSTFLFLTKNPKRYSDFLGSYPKNIVFGATLESNGTTRCPRLPYLLRDTKTWQICHLNTNLFA